MELAQVDADVLLVGHTHLPFQAVLDGRQVVNPGSVGQPKHGFPHACCAIWVEGRFSAKSRPYLTEVTARKVLSLPIKEPIAGQLADVLMRGVSPA